MKRQLEWGMGLLIACLGVGSVCAAGSPPLQIETKIPLGAVRGRIDHMAFDVRRQRLYVAELGNDSVGVINVATHSVIRTLGGLREPQGIGYVPSTDTLYVANAGDGSVRLFQGADLRASGTIALGEDADNVRVDDPAHRVFVGYGSGAIAVIDVTTGAQIANIPLGAHPESFRLEHSGHRIFVNIPDAQEIGVIDRVTRQKVASWPLADLRGNFPLALGESSNQVLAVFRDPPRLGVFSERSGELIAAYPTCRDADDLFVDARRHRVYVSCGEGYIDVFTQQAGGYRRIAHLATAPGARTSLFVPQWDRLLLAVRATQTAPAAIWVFRPVD